MRKGQLEHILPDLLPAIILIVIATILLVKYAEEDQDTFHNLKFSKENNDLLLNFLDSEVENKEALGEGLTYGDLLFLYVDDEALRDKYFYHFSEDLREYLASFDDTSIWNFQVTFPGDLQENDKQKTVRSLGLIRIYSDPIVLSYGLPYDEDSSILVNFKRYVI